MKKPPKKMRDRLYLAHAVQGRMLLVSLRPWH